MSSHPLFQTSLEGMELWGILACRFVQYQHVDDRVLYDHRRSFVVASLDLRCVRSALLTGRGLIPNTVWIGYGIVGPFLVLNARPGAMQHIIFPAVARAVSQLFDMPI